MDERKFYLNFILLLFVVLAGCTGPSVYQIELLPAPHVYSQGLVNPFPDKSPRSTMLYRGILYATDREPASSKHEEFYYRNKRGYELRLGSGEIELDRLSLLVKKDMSWEEIVKISKQAVRTQTYPLQVFNFQEYGFLTIIKIMPAEEQIITI